MDKRQTLTIVVGPTASGKSNWALSEAERTGGIIVNCDSIQIYRHFNIGSCKPTADQMARVPHYLYDFVEPTEVFTAGDYRRSALAVFDQISKSELQNRSILLVGGSGFYLQALEKGMFPVPKPDPNVQAKVEQYAADNILRLELEKRDPATALKIHPNDIYRTRRALEIILSTGNTLSSIQDDFTQNAEMLTDRFQVKKIGILIDRPCLSERVQQRTERMLESGLVAEVESLVARGFAQSKPMASVGYTECLDVIEGRRKYSELPAAIAQSTMQLAKRQMTWFKRDTDIQWIEPSQS